MSVFKWCEPCMVRHTLINSNHAEHKYYPFIISLDKCCGSCNILFPKVNVPKETKDNLQEKMQVQ